MRSTIIKRLDALELAAAAIARQKADDPDAVPLLWTGILGLIFGMAEAGLLDYSANVPVALPGYMPFDVGYVISIHGDPRCDRYTYPAGAISEEAAAATSGLLANGLWQRLFPGVWTPDGILSYQGRITSGWAIIDEACNPPAAGGMLLEVVRYFQGYHPRESRSLSPEFEAAAAGCEPDDARLIAAAFKRMARPWTRYEPDRSYVRYQPLERGEPVDLEQYL